MEGPEMAGDDAVMTPESTEVLGSAWGAMDPDISPKHPGPTLTKKSANMQKLTKKGQSGKSGIVDDVEP